MRFIFGFLRRDFRAFRSLAVVQRLPFALMIMIVASLTAVVWGAGVSSARADDGGARAFLLSEGAARARTAGGGALRSMQAVFRTASVAPKQARVHRRHAVRGGIHAKGRKWRRDRAFARAESRRKALVALERSGGPGAGGAMREASPADRAPTAFDLARKAAAAAARPSDVYLTDRTLRRGDIVATSQGLKVFIGAGHFPYRLADFTPISHARRLDKRSALLALDKTIRRDRPILVARAAAPTRATDPRAQAIGEQTARRVKSASTARPAHGVARHGIALAYAGGPSLSTAQRAIERLLHKTSRHHGWRAARNEARPHRPRRLAQGAPSDFRPVVYHNRAARGFLQDLFD